MILAQLAGNDIFATISDAVLWCIMAFLLLGLAAGLLGVVLTSRRRLLGRHNPVMDGVYVPERPERVVPADAPMLPAQRVEPDDQAALEQALAVDAPLVGPDGELIQPHRPGLPGWQIDAADTRAARIGPLALEAGLYDVRYRFPASAAADFVLLRPDSAVRLPFVLREASGRGAVTVRIPADGDYTGQITFAQRLLEPWTLTLTPYYGSADKAKRDAP